MSIAEILKITDHRPWKIPDEGWKFYQEWNNAIFLHWKVELKELQKYVPKELEIDLFDGSPWVSLVAFTMENIRPKNLPAFAPISNFDEINIRTYVKSKEKTGVYFLSIEAGNKLSCKIAKVVSELPYRFSKIKRTNFSYESTNSVFKDSLKIDFQVGEVKKHPNSLDKWLTERYALFQDTEASINQFEIHHLQWPLQEIKIDILKLNYNRFSQLFKSNPDCSHYSEGVSVIAWGKNSKKRQ